MNEVEERLADVVRSPVVGVWARRTLAVIRLANGTLGLLAPQILVKRLGVDPAGNTTAYYPFRMFGIRTIVLGADLLGLRAGARRRAGGPAFLIHSVDTVAAAVGGLRGDVPVKAARLTTAISAV